MRSKRAARVFMAACLGSIGYACAEDSSTAAAGVTCGTGTVVKDGVCVPESEGTLACGEGTVENAGKCVPASDGPPLACGDGTVEKDGACLPTATTGAIKPRVESVVLKKLIIHNESEPFYPGYPLEADIELEIKGEAHDSMVILGLSNADGSKRCFLGNWLLSHAGGPDALPVRGSHTFIVQPSCKDLAEQGELKAWVSFDPFQQLAVAGFQPPTIAAEPTIDDVYAFFLAGEFSLDGCTSSAETSHPDSCATAINIDIEEKLDVVVDRATLSTNVAVLQVSTGDLSEPSPLDPMIDAKPDPNIRYPKTTQAHFTVNADLLVYGVLPKDSGVEDVFLNFKLRPSGSDEEWLPLYAEVTEASKAGEEVEVQQLLELYLESLTSVVPLAKTSPIFISGDTEPVIATGKWKNHDFFDMLVCAARNDDDDETDDTDVDLVATPLAEQSGSNDCALFTVAVVRQVVSPNGPLDTEPTAEIPGAFWISISENPDEKITDLGIAKLRLWYSFRMYAAVQQNPSDYWAYGGSWCSGNAMNIGARAGANLDRILDAFGVNLLELHIAGCDAADDYLGAMFAAFGITLINKTISVPDGTLTLGQVVPEQWREYPIFEKTIASAGWVVPGTSFGLGVSLKVEGKIGLDGDESKISKSAVEPTDCNAEAEGICYTVHTDSTNHADAGKRCGEKGAKLAVPKSQAAQQAIGDALKDAGSGYAWVEFRTYCGESWVSDGNCNGRENSDLMWFSADPWGHGFWNGLNLAWVPGQPATNGFKSRRAVAVAENALGTNAKGALYAADETWGLQYVCERPSSAKTQGGTDFELVINPFASINGVAFGGVDISLNPWDLLSWFGWVEEAAGAVGDFFEENFDPTACLHVKVGIEGDVEVLRVDVPVTFKLGYSWDGNGNITGGVTGKAELGLSMLNGEVRAVGEAVCLSLSETLYEWDGLDLFNWTIWEKSWSL